MIVGSSSAGNSQFNQDALAPHIARAKHYQFIMGMMEKVPQTAMYVDFKATEKVINVRSIQLETTGHKFKKGKEPTPFDVIWSKALYEDHAQFEPYRQKAAEAGFDLPMVFREIDSNPDYRQTPEDIGAKQNPKEVAVKSYMDTIAARINRTAVKHAEEPVLMKPSNPKWMELHPDLAKKYIKLNEWKDSLGPNPDKKEVMLLWVLSDLCPSRGECSCQNSESGLHR